MKKKYFIEGLKNGIPIMLGYLGVSFAFGMMCVSQGLTVGEATLISLTNLTSAGQAAGLEVIVAGGSYLEMALTQVIINLRYCLMAFALSQKLDRNAPLAHRFPIAFGITDEIFAVSIAQKGPLSPYFSYGATVMGILGWTGGTFLGAVLGSVLPASCISALNVALYAMFLAIILPPARQYRNVLIVVLASAAVSCLFTFTPVLNRVSSGFVIIICTLLVSGAAALLLPTPEEQEAEHGA